MTWYTRSVLFVANTSSAVAFYVGKLEFREVWSHTQEGATLVAQVERDGCEIILTEQFREKTGQGMLFISLDRGVFSEFGADCLSKGVDVQEGWWGYRCLIVTDPDGNQLFFPDPNDESNREDQGGVT